VSDSVERDAVGGCDEEVTPSIDFGDEMAEIDHEEVDPREDADAMGDVSSSGDKRTVMARGTEDGLVLRIDGLAEWDLVVSEVGRYLDRRASFFRGGEVCIEWLNRMPSRQECSALECLLKEGYGLNVGKKLKAETQESKIKIVKGASQKGKGLFGALDLFSSAVRKGATGSTEGESNVSRGKGVERVVPQEESFDDDQDEEVEDVSSSDGYMARVAKMLGEDVIYEDEANARVVFGTMRSGQRVETPYSLVIVGDVNPGADVVAGGDILILGSLRGTAHACAYDDDFDDHVIIAMHMQPTQLRIGTIISRGSEDSVDGAEIARIDDRKIVVEPFHPRMAKIRRAK